MIYVNLPQVQLIDTGDREWVCHGSLKYLCKDFATLPPQCWPGRLACVTPRKGTQFSANASNYFYELVSYRRLFAKIEKIGDMVSLEKVPNIIQNLFN